MCAYISACANGDVHAHAQCPPNHLILTWLHRVVKVMVASPPPSPGVMLQYVRACGGMGNGLHLHRGPCNQQGQSNPIQSHPTQPTSSLTNPPLPRAFLCSALCSLFCRLGSLLPIAAAGLVSR